MLNLIALSLLCSCCCAAAAAKSANASSSSELLHSWTTVDYDWPSAEAQFNFTKDGRFIQDNCALAGVKMWKDDIFVTVPRWRPGVPATLAKVVTKASRSLLQPWPSFEMQTIGDPSSLQFVQSMEIDRFV